MNRATDQAEYWNQSASSKVFSHPIDIERLRQLVDLDAAILDFGCGHGRICGELNQVGYSNVLGVDYSTEMIRIASERNPMLKFLTVNGNSLPFQDGAFSVVLLFAVLTCIPDDEDQHQIVAELARVLRPGGLLIVSDYLLQNDPRNVTRYEEFASESGVYGTFRLSDGGIVRHHSQEHMSELLSGFNTKDWITIDAKTMNGNPARVTQIWGTKKYLG